MCQSHPYAHLSHIGILLYITLVIIEMCFMSLISVEFRYGLNVDNGCAVWKNVYWRHCIILSVCYLFHQSLFANCVFPTMHKVEAYIGVSLLLPPFSSQSVTL